MSLGAALWVAGGWSHGLQNGDNITGNVTGWVRSKASSIVDINSYASWCRHIWLLCFA